ncbi:MAG: VOC family protein [Ignavibacteriaceae bacterium]
MPKLDHIALEVSDIDKSIEFYTSKLGFSFISRAIDEKEHEEYCYLESNGFYLELLNDIEKNKPNKREIERPYCPHVCFATDDMEKTIKDLQSKNIKIINGPLVIKDEATWGYFADPDLNVHEYIQRY